jgi:hypothetical protein
MTQAPSAWAWSRQIDHPPDKMVLAALAERCDAKSSGLLSITELSRLTGHTSNECKIILFALVARKMIRFTCRPAEKPLMDGVVEYSLLVEAELNVHGQEAIPKWTRATSAHHPVGTGGLSAERTASVRGAANCSPWV